MKKFRSVPEAFDWWVKNLYPLLPAEEKKGKPVQAMQDYLYGKGISEKGCDRYSWNMESSQ